MFFSFSRYYFRCFRRKKFGLRNFLLWMWFLLNTLYTQILMRLGWISVWYRVTFTWCLKKIIFALNIPKHSGFQQITKQNWGQWGKISQKLILPKDRNIAYVLVFYFMRRSSACNVRCNMYYVFPAQDFCIPFGNCLYAVFLMVAVRRS